MKPMVFNYQDYVRLQEENRKLREANTKLQIRCRIAEADRPEWIPISERLPEEGLTVLTFDTNGDIEFGAYEDGTWEWLAESCTDYWTGNDVVIAWMPLPEPYKGGDPDER